MAQKDLRPRRTPLLQEECAQLSDIDLLAMLFGAGHINTLSQKAASSLLKEAHGFCGLIDPVFSTVRRTCGISSTRYTLLKVALELARRYLYASLQRAGPLESPATAEAFLRACLRPCRRETFGCLFLDARHQVIAYRELFLGTIDSATVHPREVARAALECNAAALILAHNHPSGTAEPSSADVAITRRIVDAMHLIDVRVLDHLVIGSDQVASMAAGGTMP